MIKAIFLDIDDTVLDFEAFVRRTMRLGFAYFHLPPYEESMYDTFFRVNSRLWHAIEQGQIVRAQLIDLRWQSIFRELGINGDGPAFERYFRNALLSSAIPMPGADEMIPWLSRRFLLCAASNGPVAQQQTRLGLAGYLPYFHHLFISEQLGVQKPDPVFFSRSLDRLNASPLPGFSYPVLPGEVLMVGDSARSDMQGGIGSGMKTCFFSRHGSTPPAELPVDFVITDLTQLKEILGNER